VPIAQALDPEINMWDVSAPFVRGWIRDELGPEAAIADRLKTDLDTLVRLPALVRRIEDRFPPKGGAPEEPPLPEVTLVWERGTPDRGWRWLGYIATLAAGGALAVVSHAAGWW